MGKRVVKGGVSESSTLKRMMFNAVEPKTLICTSSPKENQLVLL